jgi:homoserine O-acetyltransferase
LLIAVAHAQQPAYSGPQGTPGDYILHNFHFASGETLPESRIHYVTLGKPERDAQGKVTNAVLLLHGTSGSSRQFLVPQFAGVLFGPGQLLDVSRYYIIIPDNFGHGASTKPSDGMHARFPHYGYHDLVTLQHELLVNGLHVNHLRLIMGTSMGCMHSWMWGEMYPDFMDAMMPLACLPVEIAGRNRTWRKMLMDGIRNDPEWKNGDYTTEPQTGLHTAANLFVIATSAPILMQKNFPTHEAADKNLEEATRNYMARFDANDLLYAVDASRDYDPSKDLEKITAAVMFVNSADDFINPPELGIAEREIKRVRRGKFVLIPASDQTHGHSTHTWAAVWLQYLKELLEGK